MWGWLYHTLIVPADAWLGHFRLYVWLIGVIARFLNLGGLRIEMGEGLPFDTFKKRLHTADHLKRVAVRNTMRRTAATNCELILEDISGPLASRCPVKIKMNFSINAGGRELIPLAEFDERLDKTRPALSKPGLILVHFPINPLSDGKSYLDAGSYELSLLATSANTALTRVKCRLWLEDGFLKLHKL